MNEHERHALNEALFRDVNERIAESAENFETDKTEFVCECADPSCTERVPATLAEYENVRTEVDDLPPRSGARRARNRAGRVGPGPVPGRREDGGNGAADRHPARPANPAQAERVLVHDGPELEHAGVV